MKAFLLAILMLAGSARAVDAPKVYVALSAVTSSTLLRGNNLQETTTGIVVLPEVRLGYRFAPKVSVYAAAAIWGLQLLGSSNTTSLQASSRTDLNGNNNYVAAGLDFKVDELLKIGVFTENDFLLGVGYGNLEQLPGSSKYDNGILVYAGMSLTIYNFFAWND